MVVSAARAMPRTTADGPLRTPDGDRPPGLSAPGVRLVLLLGVVLMGLAWWHLEGYQIADSVEYMERAQALVRGAEVKDSQAIRSFGFTGLLVPVFALAEWTGLEPEGAVVYGVRMLQMALALALVAVTIRLAARFVRGPSALAAGALLLANPTFLQWSVSPISDVAAGLCLVLALERLLDRGPARRGFAAGVWLGLGFLMAYKTLALVLPLLALVALRERWRGRAYLLFLASGLLLCLLAQGIGDWLYYGRFGISVWVYVQENVFSPLALVLYRLGFKSAGEFVYNHLTNAQTADVDYQRNVARFSDAMILRRQGEDWYLRNIGRALVLPALLLVVLGLARNLRRLSWKTAIVVGALAFDLAALGTKGAKSFRLFLPVFPLVALLGAQGWDVLFRPRGAARAWHPRLGAVVLVAAAFLAANRLLATNTRRFGGFWRAMDVVNAAAEESLPARSAAARAAGLDEPPRVRVACAYHWGVFLRESSRVELVKLSHQIDGWDLLDASERRADLDEIASLDWFIAHLPVLRDHPELMDAVNRDFEVHAVLYDRFSFQGLGPLYVLRRRTGDPDAATFWDLEVGVDPDEYRRLHDLSEPRYAFRKRRPDGTWQELVLLGFEWRPIAGSGYGWLTYTWAGGPFDGQDYVIVDRVTSGDGPNAWQNDHAPAYGVLPTSDWGAGWVLREGYLLVPEAEPYAEEGPTRPLGGDYRRGDLMPADLWIKVVEYDSSTPPLEVDRLVPYPKGSARAVEELARPGGGATLAGHAINAELMARVGRFFIGVHPRYRWRDEFHPAPAEEAPKLGRGR